MDTIYVQDKVKTNFLALVNHNKNGPRVLSAERNQALKFRGQTDLTAKQARAPLRKPLQKSSPRIYYYSTP